MLAAVTHPRTSGATRVERECLRAAGLIGVGMLAAVALVWAATFPGWPLTAGVILSVLALGGWLLVVGAEPPPPARWLRPVALVAALVVAIGVGVLVERSGEAALQARFVRSRPAFDAAVVAAGTPTATAGQPWGAYPGDCPDRLGSYPISGCRSFAGGYLFLQRRAAIGHDAGFAYAPEGPPAGEAETGLSADGFTPVVGPWYAWSCRC